MMHHKMRERDYALKRMFDEIDDYLEDKYGYMYPLHPNRAKRGTTASKGHDGLFNVGASFSAGFGSKYGRGYVIEIDLRTLSRIPGEVVEEIEEDVLNQVREKLKVYFPDRKLDVSCDGNVYKIHGDFSLGYL